MTEMEEKSEIGDGCGDITTSERGKGNEVRACSDTSCWHQFYYKIVALFRAIKTEFKIEFSNFAENAGHAEIEIH